MFTQEAFPSPVSLITQFPLEQQDHAFLHTSRSLAQQIVTGKTAKLALIVGPCSIHNLESALLYAKRLKQLSLYVQKTLFLVMRVYVEKPRTTTGWKGFLYDPFLNGTNHLHEGIALVRSLFLQLTRWGIPIATEFVNPLTASFIQDLITWGFIGARTATSQIHRELASSLPFPIGFKNTLDGDFTYSINSILAANTAHSFLGINLNGAIAQLRSPGNPFCHLVLRGSELEPNYDQEYLFYAKEWQERQGIYHPIMVDCSHGNSAKNSARQKEVFHTVIQQFCASSTPLAGIMLESFLETGNQCFELGAPPSPTLSITDPCLSWHETEELILSCHEMLLKKHTVLRVNC